MSSIRILLVEDSEDDAKLISIALERAGLTCEVTRVELESEFTAQLTGALPDVILCDFHLPRFSYYRAVEILREHRRTVPMIVVSHFLNEKEMSDVTRDGVASFVLKSDLDSLPILIRSVLNRS